MTEIPLSHNNFLPDLTHVKVLPEAIEVMPAFVHTAPALAAALTGIEEMDKQRESIDKNVICLLFIYRP